MAVRAYFVNDLTFNPSVPTAVYQFDSTDGGVTWTSPAIYYDGIANPPSDWKPSNPNASDFGGISAGANSDGVAEPSGVLVGVVKSTLPCASLAWNTGHAAAGGSNAASIVDACNCMVDWNQTGGVNQGPWKVGGVWFLVTVDGTTGTNQTLRVYSSSDFAPGSNSGTWSVADSANSPTSRRTTGFAIYFDSTTGKIMCGITSKPGADTILTLIEFDCNAATWGTGHDAFTFTFGTYNSVTIIESMFVFSPSQGKWYLLFVSATSPHTVNYATFDGATWTTDLTLSGSFPNGFLTGCMILDPDGTTLHSWINDVLSFGTATYTYCRLDTTGPTVTHTATSPSVNTGNGAGSVGRSLIDSGVMMFPYVDSSNFGAYVWVSNSLTSPSFTSHLVSALLPGAVQFENSALTHLSVTPVTPKALMADAGSPAINLGAPFSCMI